MFEIGVAKMEHFSELNRPSTLIFIVSLHFARIVAIYCETIVEMRFIEASQLPIKLNRNKNGKKEREKERKTFFRVRYHSKYFGVVLRELNFG